MTAATAKRALRPEPHDGIMTFLIQGDAVVPGAEPWLSFGVRGTAFDLGADGIYIPLISAEWPGNGDVSRFLNGLTRARRVVVPTVISGKLRSMLLRRGFVDEIENGNEVMVRGAS